MVALGLVLSLIAPMSLHAALAAPRAHWFEARPHRAHSEGPASTGGRAEATTFSARPRSSPASIPDGAGGQYVLWSEVRDGDADLYMLRITNTGAPAAGWPADGLIVCGLPGDQSQSALFPDGAGGAIAGWLDGRDGWATYSVYGQRVNASGAPQWVANGVEVLAWNPQIGDLAAGPDGTGGLFIVWDQRATDADIYGLRITNAGALATGWSATGNVICDAVNDQVTPQLAADGSGGAVVVWTDDRDLLGVSHVFAQRVDASGVAQWSANGIQVDGSTVGVIDPTVCPASGGHSLIFWGDQAGPVLGQRLDGSGAPQWTAGGVTLHPGTGIGAPDGSFVALADGLDGAVVSWYSFNLGMEGIQAQRVDGSGAVQWGSSGASVLTGATYFPDAVDFVPDGSGGAFFAWTDFRGGVDYDIYAQRVAADGALAWTANGIAASTAAADQRSPSVALDGAGGCLVSWLDYRGLDGDIYSQRFDAIGTPQFAANGIASYANPGVQVGSAATQTSDGGTLIAWNEKRGGEYDIRARKLDGNGVPTGSSAVVTVAAGNQTIADAIYDGSGGMIVVWTSLDSGDENVYAQRIIGNGTAAWGANGVPVCASSGAQQSPSLAPDGAGGAIITWVDYRLGIDSNIYAQRINAGGGVQWAANGVPVCADAGYQLSPRIASDGAGGAIIAWSDLRTYQPLVYAQRLNAAGSPQWAANGVQIADYSASLSSVVVSGMVAGAANDAIVLVHEMVPDPVTFAITSVLHAQRVDASGSPQWGTTGSTLCDASSACVSERVIDDGAGGAYFGWSDSRNGPLDIYAQHVDALGATWSANGNVVCDAAGWHYLGGMTRSTGDVFFSWADSRSGGFDIYAHRMSSAGADAWAADGVPVSAGMRGQFAAAIAPWRTATPERLYVTWTDNRAGDERIVYTERLDFSGASQWDADGVVSTTLALSSAEADLERVRLTWDGPRPVTATIYRRTGSSDWTGVGAATSDGLGRITFEDRDIVPGTRYGYRLGVVAGSGETFLGETWVEVPNALEMALEGLSPNPARGDMVASFTLARSAGARLELFDPNGRRVNSFDVAGLAPGHHTLRLDGPRPAPGVYFLRLTQGGRSLTARGAVIR